MTNADLQCNLKGRADCIVIIINVLFSSKQRLYIPRKLHYTTVQSKAVNGKIIMPRSFPIEGLGLKHTFTDMNSISSNVANGSVCV